MYRRSIKRSSIFFILLTVFLFNACKSSSGSEEEIATKAQFQFDCDLNGAVGKMIMNVEAVANTGITWGSGTNPDITGVISTGDYTLYTEGEVRSDFAYYIFTGENSFADFTNMANSERFRVQWQEIDNGLLMVVNPFGPGPTQHVCTVTSSSYN